MPADFEDGPDSKPKSNYRKEPISQRQGELLHDLFCNFISELTGRQANALIKIFMQKNKNPLMLTSCKFDDDTLEENK